jgi:plastocyanin
MTPVTGVSTGYVRILIAIGLVLCTTAAATAQEQDGLAPQASADAQVHEIEIAAGRFSFAPDTIEVREGERVRLTVRSVDVAHGLAIPSLGIQLQIPAAGEPVTIEFVASEPGTHPFSCSVYCGVDHGRMSGTLTVRPADGDAVPGAIYLPVENDFTVVTMATTRALPRHKGAFRLTHRFTRPLGDGSFGNLVEDLFGFDSSAFVGFEYRFGLTSSTQIGGYRTSNRTIQIFGQQQLLRQRDHHVGVDLIVSIEGTNNFRDEYSPAFGAVISRTLATRVAVYAQPVWVGNTNNGELLHPELGPRRLDDESTFMVGVGSRIRIWKSLLAVGEIVPRVAGFDNGDHHATFGIESQLGGHVFQLNFSNSIGTTPAQVAQGGSEDDWFIGFNISRKFF